MMALAREALAARGIPAARVREERFFAPSCPTAATTAQALTIRRGGAITRAIVRPARPRTSIVTSRRSCSSMAAACLGKTTCVK